MRRYTLFLTTLLCSAFFFSVQAQMERSGLRAGNAPFFHGVASGDPLPNRVILWTRVSPDMPLTEVEVHWQIATDPAFTNVVNFGKATAVDTNDYTVKLDVCGLQPSTYYYYIFNALGANSVTGRTKTAPDSTSAPGSVRFGVTSCSSYEHGFFNSYASMADRNDLDAVIHLGDYIYEYEQGGYSANIPGREHDPTNEIISLDDYRTRISQYRLDDDLFRAHQLYPWITTWDDHESANDAYKDGAQNHNGGEGPWNVRLSNSTRAYREWMPLRHPDPADDRKIWRSLRYGSLLDLMVIDSRIWQRDEQDLLATNDASRTMLGNDQMKWLTDGLRNPDSKWKIIANQVMMAPLEIFGLPFSGDAWDGYNYDRERLIDSIEQYNVQNAVVLTGDIHTAWASNVPGNSWSNAMVEFVTTSTTSPGLPIPIGVNIIQSLNPHIEYTNLTEHGYYVLTVEDSETQADYVFVNKDDNTYSDDFAASWKVVENTQTVVDAGSPKPAGTGPFAPSMVADQTLPLVRVQDSLSLVVAENDSVEGCVTTLARTACPLPVVSLLDSAEFGSVSFQDLCFTYQPITNYYGVDSFAVVTCVTPGNCDTTFVSVAIQPVFRFDTVTYTLPSDSSIQDCISPNDLTSGIDTASIVYAGTGTVTWINDSCFTYQPSLGFNGVDTVYFVQCDDLGICDTTAGFFTVFSPPTTDTIRLEVNAGALASDCYTFDDLSGELHSFSSEHIGNTGLASFFNDTCFSYLADTGSFGMDTIILTACDSATPSRCDTVVYIVTVPMEIGLRENRPMAFLGAYPNPVRNQVLLQLALFKRDDVLIQALSTEGKVMYEQTFADLQPGVQYIELGTSDWPAGVYYIVFTMEGETYSRKLIKLSE